MGLFMQWQEILVEFCRKDKSLLQVAVKVLPIKKKLWHFSAIDFFGSS